MNTRIVLLGPPASGKGTLAALIAEKYGIPSASTGALLREEEHQNTALGQAARAFTREGKYFPDEMALAVVERWLDAHASARGFVLDGFPRTLAQAGKFDEDLAERHGELDIAINLELGEAEIRRRIESRLTCPRCAATYRNGGDGAREGGECPNCGAVLQRRRDDTLETLSERLRQHNQLTEPVVEYYRQTGRLRTVDAAPGSAAVFAVISQILEGVPA
ncbi:MAG TPA: nucleoside monophosphate kinase [Chthoniobacterales bacterium]